MRGDAQSTVVRSAKMRSLISAAIDVRIWISWLCAAASINANPCPTSTGFVAPSSGVICLSIHCNDACATNHEHSCTHSTLNYPTHFLGGSQRALTTYGPSLQSAHFVPNVSMYLVRVVMRASSNPLASSGLGGSTICSATCRKASSPHITW